MTAPTNEAIGMVFEPDELEAIAGICQFYLNMSGYREPTRLAIAEKMIGLAER